MVADIMNCALQTEFCMFKVNKSEFNVMMAITTYTVKAFKQMTKTYTKTKTKRFLRGIFLQIAQNAPQTLKSPNLGFSLRWSSSKGKSPQKASKFV